MLRLQLDLADQIGKEWVGNVGDDHADGLARTEHERARVDIRNIAEPFGFRLDQRAGCCADTRSVVERARYRVRRRSDNLRQILKSGLTTPPSSIRHVEP